MNRYQLTGLTALLGGAIALAGAAAACGVSLELLGHASQASQASSPGASSDTKLAFCERLTRTPERYFNSEFEPREVHDCMYPGGADILGDGVRWGGAGVYYRGHTSRVDVESCTGPRNWTATVHHGVSTSTGGSARERMWLAIETVRVAPGGLARKFYYPYDVSVLGRGQRGPEAGCLPAPSLSR